MIERDELAAWLRLLETPGLGRTTVRKLLGEFGSPGAVLNAAPAALRGLIGAAAASALTGPNEAIDAQIDATWLWLHTHSDANAETRREVITLGDALYPPALLEAADPPLLLYAQGRIELLLSTAVAVVGSRNPTPQGLDNARAFAAHLSRAGLTVISGLALGIDGAAHEGGLEGPGRTIAVVGTGLDRVYPTRHLKLAHRIAAEGLLISEYSVGTPPLSANFPQRNRIISNLSLGTLVVEAALKSGSLITARLAVESGREVFAIPGSIHSPLSRGCHALIRQGAKLVESAQDILEELRIPVPPAVSATSSLPTDAAEAKTDPLLAVMGYDPISLDELMARTGRTTQDLSGRLLELELDSEVARLPGQLFQRRSRG